MKPSIEFDTVLHRDLDQVFSEIDGEVVMLSIDNGEYYNLNEIGSHIWNLLKEPLTFKRLVDNLLLEYDVDEKVCINETKSFLTEFINKDIIKIIHE